MDRAAPPLEPGAHVRYHGSIVRHTDVEFIVNRVTREPSSPPGYTGYASSDSHLYLIVPADVSYMAGYDRLHNYLYNVRRQSLTEINPATSALPRT